uniref:ATP synthase F0 subunit 8 n=1 Tax=Crispatotrochus rubescens TaxID=2989894 RepID=UPI002237BDAE|nr:ATP synthase F0 subunit 8 [Crispatotrochus rubescens]YP_010554993.1 ATP synthase F0 subunit 8 [Crispatotrochus rugosus]UYP50960.1 ATP synthase subunit 8 [Crispatotrochus rubescens]UYP50973.1 ATP synthase subunit 8 [Crispatotrochus rugosus]
MPQLDVSVFLNQYGCTVFCFFFLFFFLIFFLLPQIKKQLFFRHKIKLKHNDK